MRWSRLLASPKPEDPHLFSPPASVHLVMQELLEPALRLELTAPVVVFILVSTRLWFGDTVFHVRWITLWNTIRRLKVPAINTYILGNVVPFDVEIENSTHEDEFVGVSPLSPKEIEKKISSVADPEVPLLAGFKTDWEDRKEIATAVSYHGPKPVPSAPDWLRPRQVHRTYFSVRGPDGEMWTLITAHEESNSWRPDLWSDHLFKGSFSAKEGVRRTILKLEEAAVEWDHNPDWMDVEPSLDPEQVSEERA